MTAGRGLRVIAGSARGRRLVAPKGEHTRPTADRVKESLFSALGPGSIVDARVLDGYAGSGALAIEALSRGARAAELVESDDRAVTAIRTNLDTLGFADRGRVVKRPLLRHLTAGPGTAGPVDLVFLDPPYDTPDSDVVAVLGALIAHGWLAPTARVVLERATRAPTPDPPGWRGTWVRTFGDTLVTVLEPERGAGSDAAPVD